MQSPAAVEKCEHKSISLCVLCSWERVENSGVLTLPDYDIGSHDLQYLRPMAKGFCWVLQTFRSGISRMTNIRSDMSRMTHVRSGISHMTNIRSDISRMTNNLSGIRQ